MDAKSVGLALMALGVVLALVGLAVSAGLLSWFGRLPGDLRMEGENVKVYVPFASMLLVSLAISLVLIVLGRLR